MAAELDEYGQPMPDPTQRRDVQRWRKVERERLIALRMAMPLEERTALTEAITAQLESLSPTSTKCVVTTELHITGKVAQFGRGIMGDVSEKLMSQFASNLNTMLDEQAAAPATDGTAPAAPAAPGQAGGGRAALPDRCRARVVRDGTEPRRHRG